MDLFRCVVLTILFTETIGGDFFISDNASDWTNATMECHLAEPDLKFAPNGNITVNIPVKINDDVWVGYYQARTAFEYFGCARKPNGKPMFKTKEDPGQCMSACGANKHIGIFGKECFCFENEIENGVETKFPYCNKICHDIDGIVCGGKVGKENKYISLYRSIGMDDIGILLNGLDGDQINCMYYVEKKFMWSNCSVTYKTICGIGNYSWIENKTNSESSFGDWNQSTIKCFENTTRPSTYNNTKSLHTVDSTPQLWTGIVRSQVTYKFTTGTSHLEHANMYGYLHKDGNKIRFELTDNKYTTKKSICVNVTDTTTKPSSTETPSSSETPSSTEKPSSSVTPSSSETPSSTKKPSSSVTPSSSESPSSYVTPSSTETSSSSSSSTTTKNNDTNSTDELQDEGGSSDVGAIVGATLSIVAVIVVVVVVVLFLRKRGFQLPFLKKAKQAPSANMIQNNKAYAISRPVEILQSTYHTDNEEYAEIDLPTLIDNEAKNGVINDAPESSDYAHDYFVLEKLEEEQYDSTKPGDQKSDPNTYNPYNTLSLEESSNYDHVGAGNAQAGKAGRKVSDSESTYNTTSLGNSYLKTSGGESNNAYSMAEETEDTYNHTNVPMHKMGLRASENDYDAI